MSMNLCKRCRSAKFIRLTAASAKTWRRKLGDGFRRLKGGDTICIHSQTFFLLKQSATEGLCPFCGILAYHFKHLVFPFGLDRDASGSRKPANQSKAPVILVRSYGDARLTAHCADRKLALWPVSVPKPLIPFTSDHYDPFDNSTGSTSSLKLAKQWLKTCMQNHAQCLKYCGSGPHALPTRVLDLGPVDSNLDPVLVVSSGKKAEYVALSHTWGQSVIPTTTSANFLHQQQGISMKLLPQNFRDAITITKALGCRFLWIDSLCIIQDDRNDWEAQSSRMHEVYRNALLTISIARAKDPHTGCFSSRDAAFYRPVGFSSFKQDKEDERKSFWQVSTHSQPFGELYSRAWVLQEQALSGRTLAYCDKTIYWSCSSVELSESKPHSTTGNFSVHWYRNFQDLVVEAETQPISKRLRQSRKKKRQIYNLWYDIVREYSQRKITHDTDKLYAISSLAEKMSHILDDKYVAGLWQRDLVRGLLWQTSPRSKICPQPRPTEHYIAPSWSWASVGGGCEIQPKFGSTLNAGVIRTDSQILIPGHEMAEKWDWDFLPTPGKHDVEILDVKCTPDGKNQFAQVLDGTIRLKGHVKTAILRLPNKLEDPLSGQHIGEINLDEDSPEHLDGQLLTCLFIARVTNADWSRISGRVSPTDNDGFDVHIAFLLTSSKHSEYCRVGFVRMTGFEDWSRCIKQEMILV